ncbi:MAG: carbamoyltransferase HypF [Nitrospirae bacterium]|nr:carbamoyltransferase HypF [Nitrospirota bacterium]
MRTQESLRLRLKLAGRVQGVGFRPFAYRLATKLGLGGWVANTPQGVVVEVEGEGETVQSFVRRLTSDAPPSAVVEVASTQTVPSEGVTVFAIRNSGEEGPTRAVVPADWATCADCLREMRDPEDRRFRYPFLTCTQCGPRFSIVTDMPYDRPATTMARFPLCAQCRTEYDAVADRRFRAETLACPNCGPQVALWDVEGVTRAVGEAALEEACRILRNGGIVAVKGLGGCQLWCDALSETAVQRLRDRKQRPHKPFAVLFPSLDALRSMCAVSEAEQALLTSPQAPIVLLRRLPGASLVDAVAPDNPYVGALLPSTPLHHLLMDRWQGPMVATSGNRSEEPIVIDEREALVRLGGIADGFLVHDRPIARPVDDSVLRVAGTTVQMVRRARGYAPTPIRLTEALPQGRSLPPILAVGGHLKNTVALTLDDRVVLSQHLGDLSTLEAYDAFRQAVQDLQRLLDVRPQKIACDLHPDYRSTRFALELARELSVTLVPVQHHHAHVAACMAEHGLTGDVFGVAWDGSGYGLDGTVWGGEFLVGGYERVCRLGHWHPFPMSGGEQSMREPRRSALAVLWETLGEAAQEWDQPQWQAWKEGREAITRLLKNGGATLRTTSTGRLFDATASLLGLCQVATFEGQAAMAVEFAAARYLETHRTGEPYTVSLLFDDGIAGAVPGWVADWRPMVQGILRDRRNGESVECVAYKFHDALADVIVRMAALAGLSRVVLTGGCFQNDLLARLARSRLERAGYSVYTHRLVPPNDGGLSLGQAMVAAFTTI